MVSRLDGLSTELHTLILLQLDSSSSLFALIQASQRSYAVFFASKEKILSASVCRQIHPEVLPIAVTVADISHLPRGFDRTAVIATLNNLQKADKSASVCRILPLSTSTRLCRLCRGIDFIISDFVKCVAMTTEKYFFSLAKDPNSGFISSQLSLTETGRLQRALFKLELYSHLFYAEPNQEPKCTALEQYSLFLAAMPSWQIEELACIYDYLIDRLGGIFDEIEDRFVDSVVGASAEPNKYVTAASENQSLVQQVDCTANDGIGPNVCEEEQDDRIRQEDGWLRLVGPDGEPCDDGFFSDFAKDLQHDRFMQHLVSLGLTFLHCLFVMDDEQRTQAVLANAWGAEDFLTKAISADNVDSMEEIKVSHGRPLEFHEDRLDEPNLAWLWSFGSKRTHDPFTRLERSSLCSWGDVFWDNTRIRSSKILRSSSKELLDKSRYRERKRRREPSAEMRVKAAKIW